LRPLQRSGQLVDSMFGDAPYGMDQRTGIKVILRAALH
jgi:hypothetical protein